MSKALRIDLPIFVTPGPEPGTLHVVVGGDVTDYPPSLIANVAFTLLEMVKTRSNCSAEQLKEMLDSFSQCQNRHPMEMFLDGTDD